MRISRTQVMAGVTALAGAAVVAVVVALAVIFTGAYNVAATDDHLPPVRWALDTTFQNSVERQAADIEVPALDSPDMIAKGASQYATLCAPCHGTPGAELPERSRHMRPQPPHLSEAAQHWSPREIYWLAENGVRMSGMPAFGPWQGEPVLWSIAAFVDLYCTQFVRHHAALNQAAKGTLAAGC